MTDLKAGQEQTQTPARRQAIPIQHATQTLTRPTLILLPNLPETIRCLFVVHSR